MSAHVRQPRTSGDHIEVISLQFQKRIPGRGAERRMPLRRALTKHCVQTVKKGWILIDEQDSLGSPLNTTLGSLIQRKKLCLHCPLYYHVSFSNNRNCGFLCSR